jgi:hypothetical protein
VKEGQREGCRGEEQGHDERREEEDGRERRDASWCMVVSEGVCNLTLVSISVSGLVLRGA